MCFFHEDSWTAEVCDDNESTDAKRTRCDECHCVIHPGQWRRDVFMQEYEVCQVCERADYHRGDEDDDEGRPKTCPEGECEYGETYAYTCCELCDKLLKAIKAAEEEEGCTGDETQPAYEMLHEAMTHEVDSAERYVAKAVALFPELAASGHLTRFGEWFDPRDGWKPADLEPVEELGWGG